MFVCTGSIGHRVYPVFFSDYHFDGDDPSKVAEFEILQFRECELSGGRGRERPVHGPGVHGLHAEVRQCAQAF